MRVLDDGGGDLAVVRRDDQNVHALRQEVVALLCLYGVVAVGDLNVELRADLLGPRLDERLVALPALLLERVHREADVDGLARLLRLALVACRTRLRRVAGARERQRRQRRRGQSHNPHSRLSHRFAPLRPSERLNLCVLRESSGVLCG